MDPLKGELIEIYIHDGSTAGKIRVDGSTLHVPLLLLMNARVGDEVLVDAGVAISVAPKRGTIRTAPATSIV